MNYNTAPIRATTTTARGTETTVRLRTEKPPGGFLNFIFFFHLMPVVTTKAEMLS